MAIGPKSALSLKRTTGPSAQTTMLTHLAQTRCEHRDKDGGRCEVMIPHVVKILPGGKTRKLCLTHLAKRTTECNFEVESFLAKLWKG